MEYKEFVSWTLVWWTLDGVGTLIWARTSRMRALLLCGTIETVAGLVGIAIITLPSIVPKELWLPVFLGVITLSIVRLRYPWPESVQRRWGADR